MIHKHTVVQYLRLPKQKPECGKSSGRIAGPEWGCCWAVENHFEELQNLTSVEVAELEDSGKALGAECR